MFFFSLQMLAQEDAWVYFAEKTNGQIYYDNPLLMLSQRALDRRTVQNIPLDSKDIPIDQSLIDQIDAVEGIVVLAKSKWMNVVHVRGTVEAINGLSSFSFVNNIDFADQNLNTNASGKKSLNNKIKAVNKNLDTEVIFNYGNSNNQIQMLNGHLLHQQNFTGAGKIIAVMDAGFPGVNVAQPFQRLNDNNLILGGYNFVDRNDNVYTANSHGTLVLSTMGGYTENQLVGTAPDASYYLYITEDAATENPVEESLWVEAAEMADSLGVDIITSSLGYFSYDNPAYSHTYEDMIGNKTFISRGSNIAFSRGIVCVASAGNSGNNSEPHVGVPAESFNTLAIGAVKPNETLATFSSIGPSFDGRIKPDVTAQGQATVVALPDGNIVTANGTSFSGPIIAGMIASFWQANTTLTNQQIIDFVKQSGDKFGYPDNFFGYGIPDFNLALTNALGLQDNVKMAFSLYPNPFTETINFTFPNNFNGANITFYNALGQLILDKNITSESSFITVNDWSNGIYFYKIQFSTFTKTGKVIKK